MSKHTPGPWEATGRNYRYIVNFEGNQIAHVSDEDTESQDELQAIGHLIAAAPEMLAGLKFLRSWLVWSNQMQQDVIVCEGNIGREKLDALIAKAEGKP